MGQIREERKRARLNKVSQMFEQAEAEGKTIDYEKMIAFCMVEFGVSRRTAREYIDPLIVLEKISIDKKHEPESGDSG